MSTNVQLSVRMGYILAQAQINDGIDEKHRFLETSEELSCLVEQARGLGHQIVLTQGTFDMVHIGHARYLREAKKHGRILIVGLDDDAKARERKGENRPVVPFNERCEILSHLRYVDAVVMKKAVDPKWHLIKAIRPDVLIAVEGTYSESDLLDLGKLCGKVVVLPRQAETSTSAKVRKLVLDGAENLTRVLCERLPKFVTEIYTELKQKEQ